MRSVLMLTTTGRKGIFLRPRFAKLFPNETRIHAFPVVDNLHGDPLAEANLNVRSS